MNLLPSQIRKENHCFYTEKSVEQLVNELTEIFKKRRFDFSSKLTVEFVTKNNFILSNKILLMPFKHEIYFMTRIEGAIYLKNNQTIIDTSISPNMRTGKILVALFTISLIFIPLMFKDSDFLKTGLYILFFFLILSLLFIFNSQRAKNNLKKKFIDTLNLKEKNCL
ncbi:hypothetical protein CYCD_11470 [Tenuifilaceae bacterium CYCD]|nr:hypothetical protein CYCD_11470 [Tenuifilaceae bacterium CYCD]